MGVSSAICSHSSRFLVTSASEAQKLPGMAEVLRSSTSPSKAAAGGPAFAEPAHMDRGGFVFGAA